MQKRIKKLFVIILLIPVFLWFVLVPISDYFYKRKLEKLNTIQVGMNQKEVTAILGSPYSVSFYTSEDDKINELYFYKLYEIPIFTDNKARISFDDQGLVLDINIPIK